MATLAVAQQAQSVDNSASAASNAKNSAAEPESGLPASAPRRPEVIAERFVAAQEAPITNEKTERAKEEREKADLAAQQEMAYWAQAMTYATGASVGVSAIATWFLFRTFRLTRVSAEKQLRAYLNVFEVQADWKQDEGLGQHRASISIQIKNTGQTPAHNVMSWMGYVSSKREPKEFGELEADSPAVAGPGQSFWMADEITAIGEDKVIEWQRGRETLYVWGKITYVDAFDEPRETLFRYVMPLAGVGDDHGRFRPCKAGNKAT